MTQTNSTHRRMALDHMALAGKLRADGDLRLARECEARARELDPTLRPAAHRMALDEAPAMALDEATIDRMVARAMRATAKRRPIPRKETTMRRPSHALDTDALFQRDHAATGGVVFRAPARRARHAFDVEASTETALKHLEDAKTHLEAVAGGGREFKRSHFIKMLQDALQAMAGAEEDGEDSMGMSPEDSREELRRQGYTDAEINGEGEDGVGETPARSVTTTGGARSAPDHRDDFRSTAAPRTTGDTNRSRGGASWRGHDSAMAGDFDTDALMQRGAA